VRVGLAALALVVLIYGHTMGFGFVRPSEVALGEAMALADPLALIDAATSDLSRLNGDGVGFRSGWQPAVAISYVLDGLLGGGAPWSFRLTNLLLLIALATAAACRLPMGAARWLVLTVVVAHPMQTAAVLDITARDELMLALFGTLAVSLRGYWSPVCGLLAMAAHPVGIVVPFLAASAGVEQGQRQRWRLGLHMAALLVWLGARFGFAARGWVPGSSLWGSVDAAQAAAAQVWVYLFQLVLPVEPIFARSPPVFSGELMAVAAASLLVVGLLMLRIRRVEDRPSAGFGVAIVIVPLLFASGLLADTGVYGESRLSWPIVGLAWFLVARPSIQGLAWAMLPVWIGFTMLRAPDWASPSTLWEAAYESRPNDLMIVHHLGRTLTQTDPARAVGLLERVTQDPDHPARRLHAHRLLVGAYRDLGEDRRALPHLARVADPREPGNEALLALRCTLETRYGVSERDYPAGTVSAPLARVCSAAGGHWPENAALQNAAGTEAAVRGDFEAATQFYRRAVELEPDNGDFRRDLSRLPSATMGWGMNDALSRDPAAAP